MVSGVIALTLSPMMCAYFLKDHDHQGAAKGARQREARPCRHAHLGGLEPALGSCARWTESVGRVVYAPFVVRGIVVKVCADLDE